MGKRAVVVFFVFCFSMVLLELRLFRLPYVLPAQSGSNAMVLQADASRGVILDRNGIPLVASERRYMAAIKPVPAAVQRLRTLLPQQTFLQAQERLSGGAPILLPVEPDVARALQNDANVCVLETWPRYGRTRSLAPQLIGHLDGQSGRGAMGLEKAYDELLAQASGSLSVRLSQNAGGRGLAGDRFTVQNENYHSQAGVQLTLDARVQRLTEEALASGGIAQGAAVVLDVRTGEILALASAPGFDPANVAASLQDAATPFFNRALGAYPVGSTFKCFIAAAALEQQFALATSFTCHGELHIGGKIYRCSNYKVHGTLDMPGALAQSCNLYFIQLAQKLQQEPLRDLMRLLGFGSSTELAPGLMAAAGNLPSSAALAVPGELANFSFGQGQLLGTPLQMAAATACIASGGVYRSPVLVRAVLDAAGNPTNETQSAPATRRVLPESVAKHVRNMMILAVQSGTGKSALPQQGGAGGKTATAQSGRFASDGSEILHTGFTGFYPAEQPRYAITVFRENGASGAEDCGPVFQAIANFLP